MICSVFLVNCRFLIVQNAHCSVKYYLKLKVSNSSQMVFVMKEQPNLTESSDGYWERIELDGSGSQILFTCSTLWILLFGSHQTDDFFCEFSYS